VGGAPLLEMVRGNAILPVQCSLLHLKMNAGSILVG
jgi:hypothetical protein